MINKKTCNEILIHLINEFSYINTIDINYKEILLEQIYAFKFFLRRIDLYNRVGIIGNNRVIYINNHLECIEKLLNEVNSVEELYNIKTQTIVLLQRCFNYDVKLKDIYKENKLESEKRKRRQNVFRITNRQYNYILRINQVLKLKERGLSNSKIAIQLNLSTKTISRYLNNNYNSIEGGEYMGFVGELIIDLSESLDYRDHNIMIEEFREKINEGTLTVSDKKVQERIVAGILKVAGLMNKESGYSHEAIDWINNGLIGIENFVSSFLDYIIQCEDLLNEFNYINDTKNISILIVKSNNIDKYMRKLVDHLLNCIDNIKSENSHYIQWIIEAFEKNGVDSEEFKELKIAYKLIR